MLEPKGGTCDEETESRSSWCFEFSHRGSFLNGRRKYPITTEEIRNDEETAQGKRQTETTEPIC